MYKRIKIMFPKGFLSRLTFLNILVIASAIAVSGWAIYNTACALVEGMEHINVQRQRQFNVTLFQYLWIFSVSGIISGSMLHYYFTKKLIMPIRLLIQSTKQMQNGKYPEAIKVVSHDEIGKLIEQYNSLIFQLQTNDQQRQKLVSDLSHEFRTPLANLNGYLHALKTGVITGDEKLYESLYQQSMRLTTMLEQLEQLKEWDYVSSQTLSDKQEFNMAREIQQCVAMFEWILNQRGIEIEVNVDEKNVRLHREGIQQVLTNLLDNAIRYYQGEGSIIISGESLSHVYRCSVSGPSVPIPESAKEHIFERFYRIDVSRSRETGGTGLGLAIAKEIIDHHGGEIGLDTKEGQNIFWFTLPFK